MAAAKHARHAPAQGSGYTLAGTDMSQERTNSGVLLLTQLQPQRSSSKM